MQVIDDLQTWSVLCLYICISYFIEKWMLINVVTKGKYLLLSVVVFLCRFCVERLRASTK